MKKFERGMAVNFTSKSKTKSLWTGWNFCLMVLSVVLLLPFGKSVFAAKSESIQYFKMLSTVEYAGNGQFRNQVETLFTVRKLPFDNDKVGYFFSPREHSFVLDKKTRLLSVASKGLDLFVKVNNQCVKSLEKVTRENIGKTWKQSFDLSSLGTSLPDELKLTLKAIRVEATVFGEMIAVRGLSEPFVVKAPKKGGGTGSIKSRVGAVYLFDPEIEDIYLSISVFEATTNINGPKEKLRHEVATQMTDAAGVPVDLGGLGKKFESLVGGLGLTKKGLKVDKEALLPQWARAEGLNAAQVASICTATACEGALNPVVTVCIPAARTVAEQSLGTLPSSMLAAATVTESLGTVGIVVPPPFLGVGVGTAAAVAGGTVGTVAIANDGGGGAGGGTTASP
jgi:hypothetical protein